MVLIQQVLVLQMTLLYFDDWLFVGWDSSRCTYSFVTKDTFFFHYGKLELALGWPKQVFNRGPASAISHKRGNSQASGCVGSFSGDG